MYSFLKSIKIEKKMSKKITLLIVIGVFKQFSYFSYQFFKKSLNRVLPPTILPKKAQNPIIGIFLNLFLRYSFQYSSLQY